MASNLRKQITMYSQLVHSPATIQEPQRNPESKPHGGKTRTEKPLRTLFLNPPSFEKFDGGASSRWPATREIESYWYPVWLTYPAGMLDGSRFGRCSASPYLLAAGGRYPQGLRVPRALYQYRGMGRRPADDRLIKQTYHHPAIKIAFVGPPVTTSPGKALDSVLCPRLRLPTRVDLSIVEYANGKPLNEIPGISYKDLSGVIKHNPDRAQLTPEQLDEMPWATEIYHRDLDVTRYNVPFLLHPFVSLYTTRGCPAQCTFCLWPQTLSGHGWRKRSHR